MFRKLAASVIGSGLHLRIHGNSAVTAKFRTLHTGISKVLFTATDKDLPSANQPVPVDKLYSQDIDILLEQIRKAKSIERTLELVSMHVDVMNNKHICSAFETIHDIVRESHQPGEHTGLQYDEIFQSLCNRVMNRARYLEPQDVIAIYKTLSKLRVANNTYVMQALLKMMCSQINEFTLKELTFLNFLLSRQRPNALVDSLKLALPLVLQVQIDQQLDSENLNEAVSCLKMACKARLKPATIEKVIGALQGKVRMFKPDHAANVIFALFSMDTPADGYMQLLKASFNIVNDNIELLPRKSILELLRLCRKQSFYYRAFFMKCCKRVFQERWDLYECYEILINLHRLGFFSPEVLNLLGERICSETDAVQNNKGYSILTLVELFSFTNHMPENIRTILAIFTSSDDKIRSLVVAAPHLFLKLVASCAMWGHFDDRLLQMALDEDFLFSAWSLARKSGRVDDYEFHLCCLQWALELYKENLKIPLNVMKVLNQNIQQKQLKSADFPLAPFLANGLGGSQFFLTGLYTHNGHAVDHVIAMRSGNYPVALSNENSFNSQKINFVEDIIVPEDSKIISVIVGNKEHYCLDPEVLKLHMDLKLRNLSKMSFSPIIINYQNWVEMADRERIPFLMHEIKQAIAQNDSSMAESNF